MPRGRTRGSLREEEEAPATLTKKDLIKLLNDFMAEIQEQFRTNIASSPRSDNVVDVTPTHLDVEHIPTPSTPVSTVPTVELQSLNSIRNFRWPVATSPTPSTPSMPYFRSTATSWRHSTNVDSGVSELSCDGSSNVKSDDWLSTSAPGARGRHGRYISPQVLQKTRHCQERAPPARKKRRRRRNSGADDGVDRKYVASAAQQQRCRRQTLRIDAEPLASDDPPSCVFEDISVDILQRRNTARREEKEEARQRYDLNTRPLEPIPIGASVRIQDHSSKLWNKHGTEISVGKNGDYRVQLQSGRVYCRNRRFIRLNQTTTKKMKIQPQRNVVKDDQPPKKESADTTGVPIKRRRRKKLQHGTSSP